MKNMVVLMAALSLVACAKDDGDSKSKQAVLLARKPIIQKENLTEIQMQEISQITLKTNVMPDLSLAFDPKHEDPKSMLQRAEKLKSLKPESKEILNAIKANCEIQHPESVKSGDLKKAGAKEISKMTSKISGKNCSVERISSLHSETTVIDTNLEAIENEYAKTGNTAVYDQYHTALEFSSSETSLQKIISEKLMAQIGVKEVSSRSETIGKMTASAGKTTSSHVKMKGLMVQTTLHDQKIRAEFEVELMSAGDRTEAYFEINFQYPSSSPTLQVYVSQGTYEFHLNGQPITKDEMIQLFGENMNVSAD